MISIYSCVLSIIKQKITRCVNSSDHRKLINVQKWWVGQIPISVSRYGATRREYRNNNSWPLLIEQAKALR